MKRVLLVLGLLVSAAWAHRYHTSLTTIEYNPATQSAEITMRLLAQDLERVLTRELGGYQQLAVTPEIEKTTRNYIWQHFKMRQGEDLLALTWIGMEFDAESVYVYVEAPLTGGFADLAVHQQVFCELATVQINTVNFKDKTGVQTQTHKRGHGFKSLSAAD